MQQTPSRHRRDRAWRRSRDALERLRPQDATVSVVLLAAALALVPLVLATLAFGHAFRASETGRVDARLAAATREALDRIVTADTSARSAAAALAAEPAVQRALARGDGASLHALGYRRGPLVVTASLPSDPQAPSPPGAIERTVSVVSSGLTIGHVDAVVELAPMLQSLGAGTHTKLALARDGIVDAGALRTWRVRGSTGQPEQVRFAKQGYRVLHEPVSPGVELVAAASDRSIGATVHRRQLVTLSASALTIAALAVVGLVIVQRRRAGGRAARSRRGDRSPVALVGEVVAASHDPRALLPVILETAVVAMSASGGRIVWDGERIAAIGLPAAADSERLVFSLDHEAEPGSGARQIVLYPPRGGFSDADREVAAALVAQGRIALENARLHSVVRRQAVTDELTDLANRRRFMEVLHQEVARAARFGSPLALALCDLDNFKQINDRCGHQAGDDVLRSAAEVIRHRVRETDLPARVGGEEFAVILSGTDLAGAYSVAEQLRHDLSQHVSVPAQDWVVTASFGVAVLGEGQSAELLIGAADRALYRAKAEGRNRVCTAEAEPSAA
jgi:diguanylate cyclase (GGDEF)-like protein